MYNYTRIKKAINLMAWFGFCFCGLLCGISISQAMRTHDTLAILQLVLGSIGAVLSITFFQYTKEKPKPKLQSFDEAYQEAIEDRSKVNE